MEYIINYQYGKSVKEAISKLYHEVNDCIRVGFEPTGGITIEKEQSTDEYIACQAMIRKD